jgi:hypothetical protein
VQFVDSPISLCKEPDFRRDKLRDEKKRLLRETWSLPTHFYTCILVGRLRTLLPQKLAFLYRSPLVLVTMSFGSVVNVKPISAFPPLLELGQ